MATQDNNKKTDNKKPDETTVRNITADENNVETAAVESTTKLRPGMEPELDFEYKKSNNNKSGGNKAETKNTDKDQADAKTKADEAEQSDKAASAENEGKSDQSVKTDKTDKPVKDGKSAKKSQDKKYGLAAGTLATKPDKNKSVSNDKSYGLVPDKPKKAAAAGSGKADSNGDMAKAKKANSNSNSKNKSKSSKSTPAAAAVPPAKSTGSKKAKPKKKQNKLWVFCKAFILTIVIVGLLCCIAGGAYTAYVISNAETIHPDKIYDTLDVSSHIYDDKENLVDEIYYSENRKIISYEELPDDLKNAFIAVEDKTFWSHKGFNFRRIIGAILERFKGGRISGTSTITQQLARNVFLPEDKSVRSIKRKITEMYYAYEIEEELSKEDILTAYLNTIYLGYGCYGVDTAARAYFSCSVQELSLEQCAALAALPQAPGAYSLIVTEKGDATTKIKKGMYANDASQDRRYMILRLMEEQGYITAEEREAATKPIEDFIDPGSSGSASKSAFKDYLIETITKDLMEQYDLTEEQATKIIFTKGLNIYSTMDSQAQKAITKQFANKENFPSAVKKSKGVQAAMVITEVGTGKIKAMVGSRSASGQMLFNRATNPRQPGSSIKPLSVYAPALQKSYEYLKKGSYFKFVNTGYDRQGVNNWGNYITVSSEVTDERMVVNGKEWPHNVTRSYSGHNTFRTAIQKSINTCAVKILAQVGISYSMDMVESFGITTAISDTSESHNDLNLAALGLGAMTEGASPLDMSIAYATFPNGGVRNTPICYTRVDDANGRTLLEGKSEKVKVLDPGVAWIMTDVLKSIVTRGIATNAAVSGIQVGGKTGTTDDRYDIWFNGFTPTYSAALWIGTDDNVAMDSGSNVAASLWSKIMSNVKRAKKGEYKTRPSNVTTKNGEYYIAGTEPPDPEPEEDEEEEEGDKDDKGKDKEDGGKKEESEKKPEKDD